MKKEKPNKSIQQKSSVQKITKTKKLQKRSRYFDVMGLAIIILLGIIIYSNSFNCSFHFDDLNNIVNNVKIRNLSDIKAWWNSFQGRPAAMFTFALNYHFNELDVRYYHLVNLIIHLINACLVWWLTFLIFSAPALKDHPITRQKKVIALFTALLFVSHPLATQSVTYIVQRMASLVAMFYLLSLALYVKARLSGKGNKSKYLLFAGSLIFAVLALLTKENAFTLPFAILFFDIFFLRKKKLSLNFEDYRFILIMAIFLGFILIILFKYSSSIFKTIPPDEHNDFRTITSFNYLLTQFSVIAKYIQLLFLPVNQNLDYDFPISNKFFETRTLLSFLLLLSLFILAIFLFKKNRIISFGIFWFFLTLAIESSIIPIADLIFEHRTYLPSFGFFLILSFGIYILFWKKYKYFAISVFVIIIGSNSFLTYERNKVWKDDLTLWSDVISKSPNKARPFDVRGLAYGNLGQMGKAITDYSRAIEINPRYFIAYCNRGATYDSLGQWDKAITDYSKAIEIDPKFSEVYYNRGITYGNIGQWNNAIADYSKVIEIEPQYTKAYYNRGIIYDRLGQWDKAITDYSRAIEIEPNFAIAYYNRGISYGNIGQWNDAIADYSKAIENDSKNINAFYNRGIAYGHVGLLGKSILDFTKAIEIDPKFANAFFNRGFAYSSLGQWDKAIADYSEAIKIDPKLTVAYSNRELVYKKMNIEKK